jgi:shikimate kinase
MSTAKARAVFLVGFMGAGKTAAGEALARRLRWRFVDLDARVEAREGRSIAEIFAAETEAGFRRAETAALHEVIAEVRQGAAVVALGGGTFVEPRNIAAVQNAGATVFLEASLDVLRERAAAAGQTRPLLGPEPEFARLYGERITSYRRAGVTVNTENKSAAEVAAEIAHRLGLEGS